MMNLKRRQMNAHLGHLDFRTGLVPAYAHLCRLPNALSPGGPGCAVQRYWYQYCYTFNVTCIFIHLSSIQKASSELKFLSTFLFPSLPFSLFHLGMIRWGEGSWNISFSDWKNVKVVINIFIKFLCADEKNRRAWNLRDLIKVKNYFDRGRMGTLVSWFLVRCSCGCTTGSDHPHLPHCQRLSASTHPVYWSWDNADTVCPEVY